MLKKSEIEEYISYTLKKQPSAEKEIENNSISQLGKIEELRKEIDECDRALVKIFQHRMEVVLDILDIKRKNCLPILNIKREEEIISKAVSNLSGDCFKHEIEQFMRQILRISRSAQSKKLFPYNVVLIGFMGTGKSTIGRDLAEKLEMDYKDTDTMIQEKMGMPISEIFEKYGEDYFREVEGKVVEEASNATNTIIICGGGVVLNKKNVEFLKKKGRLVLLKAQPETIHKRLHGDESRPVLRGCFSLAGLQELMTQRNEAYNDAADITVETDYCTVDEISTKIITMLYSMD